MRVLGLGVIVMGRFRVMPVVNMSMIIVPMVVVPMVVVPVITAMRHFGMGSMRLFAMWLMRNFRMSVIIMRSLDMSMFSVSGFFVNWRVVIMRIVPVICMDGVFVGRLFGGRFRLDFMPVILMRRFFMRFMRRSHRHRHGGFQRGGVEGILRKIVFAPVDETVKGEEIIIQPFKQREREHDERDARHKHDGQRHRALKLKRQHDTGPRERRRACQKHDELHAVRKTPEKTQNHKNADHRTERRQSVLRDGCTCIAHIESVGGFDGGRRIKHFRRRINNEREPRHHPHQKQHKRLHITPR